MINFLKKLFGPEKERKVIAVWIFADDIWRKVWAEDVRVITHTEARNENETGTVPEGYEQLELPGIL
jgi:hypothetical protein